MATAFALLAGFVTSLLLSTATQASDHIYYHHTPPEYVDLSAPVYYSPGYYAPARQFRYAPHAYVASSAFPLGPVIHQHLHVGPAPPTAVWSCCPPRYHPMWPGYYGGCQRPVRVDYKYGLFGRVKGVIVRY